MKNKYLLKLIMILAFPFYSMASLAATDPDALCGVLKNDWVDVSNGDVGAMREFQVLVDPQVCPQLRGAVSKRIEAMESEKIAPSTVEPSISAEKETKTIGVPGARSKSSFDLSFFLSCDVGNDIASIDQGNVDGVNFHDVSVAPRSKVFFDISGVSEGYAYSYETDVNSGKWMRLKTAARNSGSTLLLGAIGENKLATVAFFSRLELNLASMSFKGMVFAEGKAGLGGPFGRQPRMWVESIGRCSYLNEIPELDLTSAADYRVVSRMIPAIPKMP
jgi:hypothetical protein